MFFLLEDYDCFLWYSYNNKLGGIQHSTAGLRLCSSWLQAAAADSVPDPDYFTSLSLALALLPFP
jgi:hypothetical protein